jgi:hypothetical protein
MSQTTREWAVQQTYRDWYASTRYKATQPDLTPEEKARPFAKYYHEDIPDPDPAHRAKMDKPCDPALCIGPERLNDLLNPGYLDMEIGWCNLPNGAGFIANMIHYPDITAEMIDWWFCWHTLEDLRYRIWFPPQHAAIMLSPENRRHMIESDLPFAERTWGMVHHVTEDIGLGMENIDIHFISPAAFGFDMSRFKEPYASTFAGGFGWACPVNKTDASITAPALMCHIFRPHPKGGLEHRTRFWMGYRFSEGKRELSLPPGITVPPAAIQGLAIHNVREFTRFKYFLPRIYKELGGTMEC